MNNSPEFNTSFDSKAYLDALHSQTDNPEHRIPITKITKIRDFSEIQKKPTDIDLSELEEKTERSEEKKFSVPQPLLDKLEELVKEGHQLRSLKFDIEESLSVDEIVKRLSSSTLLTPKETEELLTLVWYTKNKTQIFEQEKEKITQVESVEDLDEKLARTRGDFVELFVPYIKSIDDKKIAYAKLILNLKENSPMPTLDEPKELVLARREYLEVRKQKRELSEDKDLFDIEETAILRAEIWKLTSERVGMIIEKGAKNWSRSQDNENASLALLEDLGFLVHPIPAPVPVYSGFRPSPEELKKAEEVIEIKPEEIIPVAQVIPVIETQQARSPELVPEVKAEQVQAQEVVKEETISSPDVIPEFIVPIPFGEKEIKVCRGSGDDMSIIRVLLNDVEIAKGKITNKGSEIKIHKNFEHTFMMADTEEEKALKVAGGIIKTFKL